MAVALYSNLDVIVLVSAGYLLYHVYCRYFTTRTRSTAPGPPAPPFVGNAYQIPHDRQWLKFDQWIKQYGDVVYITVMGQPTVILGSAQAASDLLDARGHIYSNRPKAVMAGELVGWDLGLGYAPGPHSPRFKEFRRMFQQFMGPRSSHDPRLLAAQEQNAARLLCRLLDTPDNFFTHVRQSTGALILYLSYGYEVSEGSKKDRFVDIAEESMRGFSRASEPGAYLVDTIPWLRYIPDWIPGLRWKKDLREMRTSREDLYDVPFEYVMGEMTKGTARHSFVSSYLEEKGGPGPTSADQELIKAAAASLYSGGADTTPSSLASFILAMTLHPEIQERAQQELDYVLGHAWQRLPSFADRPNLPYIEAIVLEILRWNPAVPLGLAHRLAEDDNYKGYHFTKGTIFWANIWTMLHDESTFPEPQRFMPERFMNEDGSLRKLARHEDPAMIGFGFGRRICPGMYFAHNSIFIAVAQMLYVLDIKKARGESGNEIVPEVEYDGFISHPRAFPCSIKPRSNAAADLASQSAQTH